MHATSIRSAPARHHFRKIRVDGASFRWSVLGDLGRQRGERLHSVYWANVPIPESDVVPSNVGVLESNKLINAHHEVEPKQLKSVTPTVVHGATIRRGGDNQRELSRDRPSSSECMVQRKYAGVPQHARLLPTTRRYLLPVGPCVPQLSLDLGEELRVYRNRAVLVTLRLDFRYFQA